MGSYSFGTTVCAWPAMLDIVSLTSDQRLHPPWWPHGLGTAANAIAISRETVQALKRANDTWSTSTPKQPNETRVLCLRLHARLAQCIFQASVVPADCRVSLTPDKFAALRVDSAGQVLLETMPCDEITVATNYLASAQLVAWRTALALHCAAAARQRSPNDDDDDKQCQREY